MIAFNQGQAAVTAATASVVIAIVPVITALMAGLIYREKLRIYQWCAIFIELIGVIVLTLMNGVFSINKGLFWLFLAVLFLSSYNLIQRHLTKTYTALQTSTYSIFIGTLMLAIFSPASFRELSDAPPIQYFYLVILGAGSGALAYVAWAEAFSKAKQTSQVSNYMFVTPFLTTLLGFLLAGEVPDRPTIYGGIIIFTGILIFNFGGRVFNKSIK